MDGQGVAARRETPPTGKAGAGRIYQLDAIRGVLALGVMVYHIVPGAPLALGTWGVYAFFVLSGYALDHVYRGRLDARSFALARVARLAPLWVPVVLVSAALYGIHDPARIALNLTGLFGFVAPGATSIVTGGWSIGIEVVCYALFPLLVRLPTRAIAVLAVLTVALRVVTVAPITDPLGAGWVAYTVPASFLCFFVAGMLASRLRLVRRTWTGRRAGVAAVLGDLSYGTYLLHPLVALAVGPLALAVTPALALAIHRWYEVPAGRVIRQTRTNRRRYRSASELEFSSE